MDIVGIQTHQARGESLEVIGASIVIGVISNSGLRTPTRAVVGGTTNE